MLPASRKLSPSATKLRSGFLYTFQTLACQSSSGDPAMKCSCAWNLPVLHSGNQTLCKCFHSLLSCHTLLARFSAERQDDDQFFELDLVLATIDTGERPTTDHHKGEQGSVDQSQDTSSHRLSGASNDHDVHPRESQVISWIGTILPPPKDLALLIWLHFLADIGSAASQGGSRGKEYCAQEFSASTVRPRGATCRCPIGK